MDETVLAGRNRLQLHLGRGLVVSALLAALGYLVFSVWAGWGEMVRALEAIGWAGLAAALALSLVNYAFRFFRWQMFLSALGHPQPAGPSAMIYVSGFALTTTPGKAGELLRSVLLERRGVPYMQSMAAFLSERLSDLMAVVLISLPGVASEPRARIVVVLAVAGILLVGALLARGDFLGWLLARLRRRASRPFHLAAKLVDILIAARRCHSPALLAVGILLGLLAWGAEGVAFHLILERIGAQVSLEYAVFVYGVAMLAGALSFLPGGLGGAEAVMVALLIGAGVPEPLAVAATIVIRLTTLWFAVALGILALVVARRDPALAMQESA